MSWLHRLVQLAVGVLAVCGLLLGSGSPSRADRYTNYPGFTAPEEAVLPEREVHPSLWFTAGQLPALREKRQADAYLASLWNSISWSTYLYQPLPAVPPANASSLVRQYYADMSRIAKYNAFYWVMTEDEFHRDRAVQALMRAYDGPIYTLNPNVSGSPVDEIYRATWLQNFLEAYDWVRPTLTAAQDAHIRAALAKEAQTIYENLENWAPRPHNHLSKPAWALGSAALTLSSHPMAKAWLAEALRQVNRTTAYYFSSDGIYREGAHYFIFSCVNLVPFLYHYKNVSGVDLFPYWQPAFEWALYVRNGRGWLPNIGDSWIKPAPLHMVASQYMDVGSPLHPTARLGNLFQWSYFNTDLRPWTSYTGASLDDTWDIHEFLTYDPTIEPIAPQGTGTVFLNVGGQTVFRNNWTYNDPSHRYLLFHGVAWGDNHSHFDTLSFIIHAENQLMASDSGYTREAYGDAERTAWYETPAAHNVVTLDGRTPFPPDPFGPDITPVSRYGLATPFVAFQEKEAPYARGGYKGTQRRAVLFPGLDYFIVADILTSVAPAQWDLYLHGGRGSMSGEGNLRVWEYGKDVYGDAARFAAWIFPADAAFVDRMGEVTYIRGDYAAFPYVQATQHGPEAMFLQVLVPLASQQPLPEVTDASTDDALIVRVAKGAAVDAVMQQRGGGAVTFGDVQSDGTFVWLRQDLEGRATQWLVREATSLSVSGVEHVRVTGGPITMALDVSDPAEYYGAIADAPENTRLRLQHVEGWTAVAVTWQGRERPVIRDGNWLEVEVSGTGELRVQFARH